MKATNLEKYLPVFDYPDRLGKLVKPLQSSSKVAIVTDENIAGLYLTRCRESLEKSGFETCSLILPPGEETKHPETYISVLNFLASESLSRKDGVVALGGGVIGDLVGFAAATYMRGINVYQVPTSLLAMVDSSIGGKTGIDLEFGKNLVGAFHVPKLVLTDVELLETLPGEEFLNGMAEVIKTGVLAGPELWQKIERLDLSVGMDSVNREDLWEVVRNCAEYKAGIVAEDEKDLGLRGLLNLGHTIGHAIESLSDYSIKHGFAVATGLMTVIDMAIGEGWTDSSRDSAELQAVSEKLENMGYVRNITHTAEEVFDKITRDKKRKGNEIELIVPRGIGKCEIKAIPLEEFRDILNRYVK